MLFQCVNLHSIGVYNCGDDVTAGVVCLNTIITATLASSGLSIESDSDNYNGLPNTYITITVLSGSLVGTAVLIIIGIISITIIIVYIQRMKLKR